MNNNVLLYNIIIIIYIDHDPRMQKIFSFFHRRVSHFLMKLLYFFVSLRDFDKWRNRNKLNHIIREKQGSRFCASKFCSESIRSFFTNFFKIFLNSRFSNDRKWSCRTFNSTVLFQYCNSTKKENKNFSQKSSAFTWSTMIPLCIKVEKNV